MSATKPFTAKQIEQLAKTPDTHRVEANLGGAKRDHATLRSLPRRRAVRSQYWCIVRP
jgi:hypothetical protein